MFGFCFVFLKAEGWIQTKSQWCTESLKLGPVMPKATAQHYSEQTRKPCSLLIPDPDRVDEAKQVLKILVSAWQTNSCGPTGTCAMKPAWRWALPSALSLTLHSMRVGRFKN